MLDPALIRPGRFDRIIYVGAPDFEGRIEVLKVGEAPTLMPDAIDRQPALKSWTSLCGRGAKSSVTCAELVARVLPMGKSHTLGSQCSCILSLSHQGQATPLNIRKFPQLA